MLFTRTILYFSSDYLSALFVSFRFFSFLSYYSYYFSHFALPYSLPVTLSTRPVFECSLYRSCRILENEYEFVASLNESDL